MLHDAGASNRTASGDEKSPPDNVLSRQHVAVQAALRIEQNWGCGMPLLTATPI